MEDIQDLELRKAFFIESVEILERLDSEISGMEANPSDLELINAVFRGLHTIKGNSSFLNLEKITKISHAAETLLDKVRKKEVAANSDVIKMVRRVFSDLREMIEEQNIDLDVSLPISIIQRFLQGDSSGVKALSESASETPKVLPSKGSAPSAKVILSNFVRVDEIKIGKIASLASELELLRYSLEKIPERMDLLGAVAADLRFDVDLQVSKLSRLTKSLSGIIFGVRLVPVNQVFQRFPKVVKELASKLNKDIQLEILNGEAELDKAIVEAIADPMTHLIRNSADHGIETASERIKSGKKPGGKIRLNSYVKGNFVFIEITDNGRGIDGNKILQKAVEKGIVPKEKMHTFTEAQKLALIFAPGFSTAEKVTDISGRGVGMDVVKSNINRLKGTVLINSQVGKGTVIQLRFPMSMVVLFSLFVTLNEITCAFPVAEVEESLDYEIDELLDHVPEGEDPNRFYQIYSLRTLLWGMPETSEKRYKFHTLRFKDNEKMIFLVDDFSSIEDAVVQSVDSYIAALPGIQGASLRKDGSVAIMLNTETIVSLALRSKPYAVAKIKEKFDEDDKTGLTDFLTFSEAS